jgi:ketosteroid isomerase-like protein
MDQATRNELLDDYFGGIDARDADRLEAALSADIRYEHPATTVHGLEDAITFMVDDRPPQDSAHEIERRIHVEDVSVAEGRKVGTVEGEPVDTGFCDVFEFDADESAIASIGVYVRE